MFLILTLFDFAGLCVSLSASDVLPAKAIPQWTIILLFRIRIISDIFNNVSGSCTVSTRSGASNINNSYFLISSTINLTCFQRRSNFFYWICEQFARMSLDLYKVFPIRKLFLIGSTSLWASDFNTDRCIRDCNVTKMSFLVDLPVVVPSCPILLWGGRGVGFPSSLGVVADNKEVRDTW